MERAISQLLQKRGVGENRERGNDRRECWTYFNLGNDLRSGTAVDPSDEAEARKRLLVEGIENLQTALSATISTRL